MDLTPADRTRLIFTPNPVTCDGQRNIAAQLVKGETLAAFLARTVPEDMGHGWEVRINGVVVPHEVMSRVRPKDGTVIEVRSLVKKQALYIIAMVALVYFTGGLGAAAGGTIGGALGLTGTALTVANAAIFVAGSILINKVLGPKPPKVESQQQDSVLSIGAARNQPRPYQPYALTFGRVRVAPDVSSLPYTWIEGNDMYLGMVLSPGFNVGRIEALDNGDTPLSSYEGVAVYHKGFSEMADQDIPLYSNANTIQGGELFKPNPSRMWVERTTPEDTVRVQINLDYLLGDQTSKGKPYTNRETIEVQYRAVGETTWQPLASQTFYNADFNPKRATISADVERGQYDIRASRVGQAMDIEGQNGRAQFQWTTMTAVQAEDGGYNGAPQIGVRIKASGQLNGAPDELRGVIYSAPCPVWNGTSWVVQETSNPGAHMLLYARGIYDNDGKLVAGVGLDDEMIDIEAMKGFMLHCAANNYTYDYQIKDPRSHDEMLASLALVAMGQHTWASGKLSVVWAAEDQPISGIVNMATIKKGQFQVDYTLANLADGIEYSYFNADNWDTGVVRISAPGVTTPLNPATVSGEGITRAEHAAELARWHMAQSIYQYKDISYSTDLEHLSYRRLDLLQLQHDLTQWGYGGRVQAAVDNAGVVTLTLDEPVPAPSAGNAFIGLRIPGERSYRTFPVAAFTGETNMITLAAPWPEDADFPGEFEDNPAHDTIWIYDFKATPGNKVRVVGIQPESDLKGASVAVVPESPEYWNYIKTGTYEVPPNQSLLRGRPEVHNLVVTQVVAQDITGGAIELQADFDVTGWYERAEVYAALITDGITGQAVKVADTMTNTATWTPASIGTYVIEVRPFNGLGQLGVSDTVTFTVIAGFLDEPALTISAVGVADAVVLTASTSLTPGARYVWERALTAFGPWFEFATTDYPAITYPEIDGIGAWFRVTADSFGRRNPPSAAVYAIPAVGDFSNRVMDLRIGMSAAAITTEDGAILCTEDGAWLLTERGDGDEIEVDCRYSRFRLALTKDVGDVYFINVKESHELVFEVRQMGSFTIAWPPNVVPVSGIPYQPTPYPGAVDVVRLITMDYGTNWRLIVEKSGFGLAFSPSPATATAYYDGVDVAPSVTVTATPDGANGAVTHAWVRADTNGGDDMLISDATSASPSFSLPAGSSTVSVRQLWRDKATDIDGGIAQGVVEVTLARVGETPVHVADVTGTAVASPGALATAAGMASADVRFGTGPYTYAWTVLTASSAGVSIGNGNAAVPLTYTGSGGSTVTGTARVTVTDSLSVSHSDDFAFSLTVYATNPPPSTTTPPWDGVPDYREEQ